MDAERLYADLLALRPAVADVWHLRGAAAAQAGQGEKAVSHLSRAIELAPDHAKARADLGVVLMGLGRLEAAEEAFRGALRVVPDFAKVHFDLANLLAERRDPEGAVESLQRALEIDPGYVEAHYNLGLLFADHGRMEEAETSLRAAVTADPGHGGAWGGLGNVLSERGEEEEAEACYQRALALDAGDADALYNLANLFNRRVRLEEAVATYRKVLSLRPGDQDATAQLFHLLQRACDWSAMGALEGGLDRLTDAALAAGGCPGETAFMSITRHMDPGRNHAVARAWSKSIQARFEPVRRTLGFHYEKREKERIRLAYVSGNFFDHPTAHNTGGLYRLHDRDRFEVSAYSYGRRDDSLYRRGIEEACDRFVDVSGLGPADAARRIHEDGADILIGLMGHTVGSRLEIAALRPAPIQVAYLTFPGSLGADFFDYVLTDHVVTPDKDRGHYSETPVFLPDTYWPTDNALAIAAEVPSRAEEGLPAEGIVFSSFNHAQKIEPVMFGAWMEILSRVEDSVLWLLRSNDLAVANLRREAEVRGIDPARLVFADNAPKDRHLARLRLADMVLDTRIYNGHTTTTDALWAGVPVLTVPGRHFASRVSASVLRAMDLDSLVFPDVAAMVEAAVRFSGDRDLLATLKAEVATKRGTTALFDTQGLVRHLEDAYGRMWEDFLAGRAPSPIDLAP